VNIIELIGIVAGILTTVSFLPQVIKTMQDSQATLRSWLTDSKEIGWIDEKE